MLTREQYNYGAADNASEKVKALFRLRNSTRSLIIQCLADREIQKEKYDKSGEQTTEQQNGAGEQSGAYGYNSGVIHSPHVWCKVRVLYSIFKLKNKLNNVLLSVDRWKQ